MLLDLYSHSLEIIFLVIAVMIDAVLAYAVYRSAPKSATNRIFAFLTTSIVFWLVVTYAARIHSLLPHMIYIHRLGIFFAAPMSAFFLLLAHTIPSESLRMRKSVFYVVLAGTAIMMLLNISPYAFVGDVVTNGVSEPIPGIGLLPFSLLSTLFSILAVYFLVKRYVDSRGMEKKQVGYVLAGILIMLSLIIFTILFPILIFGSLAFLPFTPLYTLAFFGLTAYAITKYQLFNIKVLLAQALTLLICLVLFAKIFGEDSFNAQVIDLLTFLFVIFFGFFLVRSVRREVEQRETIEKQEQELEAVNRQQESLLHFISHEIKGYLTKGQNAFAGIVEGDYGEIAPGVKTLATGALSEMRKGVSTVMDILDASNLKKGTMSFERKGFDLKQAVLEIVGDLKNTAEAKGLHLETILVPAGSYMVIGDETKLRRHVIRNLIDNSIRYTLSGKISVSLSKNDHVVRFSVADTGVGITEDDMAHLFTQGGHGKDSIKINVDSTGYGLFVAKQVTEAHGGKIWAESLGAGKGATFNVELPAA